MKPLAIMLLASTAYASSALACPGDLNGDHVVDMLDLNVALGNNNPSALLDVLGNMGAVCESVQVKVPCYADTYINSVNDDANFGGGTTMLVGQGQSKSVGLAQFDLAGIDPDCITSAKLQLIVFGIAGEPGTYLIHPCGSFIESEATWNQAAEDKPWQGGDVQPWSIGAIVDVPPGVVVRMDIDPTWIIEQAKTGEPVSLAIIGDTPDSAIYLLTNETHNDPAFALNLLLTVDVQE